MIRGVRRLGKTIRPRRKNKPSCSLPCLIGKWCLIRSKMSEVKSQAEERDTHISPGSSCCLLFSPLLWRGSTDTEILQQTVPGV